MKNSYTYKINHCGIHNCTIDWAWDNDGFPDYDVWAVFGGIGTLTVAGRSFSVKQGDCFLLPPNTPVSGRHNPDFPLQIINVHFNFLQNDTIVFPYSLLHKFISSPDFFKSLLNRLVSAHYSENHNSAVSWMSAVITEFLSFPFADDNKKLQNSNFACINEICSVINENVACSTSLSDFAKQYGYSTTYLGKLFHSITGVSFSQYLSNVRINQAKLLLSTSDESVADIAEKLGYYNACHFINQFKKIVGCPPGSYRKKRPL